jgi:hypothetical protein
MKSGLTGEWRFHGLDFRNFDVENFRLSKIGVRMMGIIWANKKYSMGAEPSYPSQSGLGDMKHQMMINDANADAWNWLRSHWHFKPESDRWGAQEGPSPARFVVAGSFSGMYLALKTCAEELTAAYSTVLPHPNFQCHIIWGFPKMGVPNSWMVYNRKSC